METIKNFKIKKLYKLGIEVKINNNDILENNISFKFNYDKILNNLIEINKILNLNLNLHFIKDIINYEKNNFLNDKNNEVYKIIKKQIRIEVYKYF